MKVLFLDVDGVLNTYNSGGIYTLTKSKLRLLQYIVEQTNCKIVLSSTWRKGRDHMVVLIRALNYRGLRIHDVTPRIGIRGVEVANWMADNTDVGVVYAILDDVDDFLPYQKSNLFLTDSNVGLTKEIADKVISHFDSFDTGVNHAM